MDFFSKCNTKEEAKATFKRLCKCFHPDKGGEEALMIELKSQYDTWKPSYEAQGYKFNFVRNSTLSLDDVYEKKINELNGLVYHLRNELDALRSSNGFNNERLQAEVRAKYYFQDEARKQQDYCDNLNVQLEEKKQELIQERERHKNRSLADKIKTIFGYE